MAMCWNTLQGPRGPVLCGNPLTRENVKRGNVLCDECSGRAAANRKLARPKPVLVADYEQLELFA